MLKHAKTMLNNHKLGGFPMVFQLEVDYWVYHIIGSIAMGWVEHFGYFFCIQSAEFERCSTQ